MTAPYTFNPGDTQARTNSILAQTEWGQFQKDRKALVDEMIAHLGDFGDHFGLTQPPSQLAPTIALDETQAAQLERQRSDMVARAHFWNIPNPENLPTDQLQQMISAKRMGEKKAPAGSIEAYALGLGAAAVNASSAMAELAGHVFGNLDKIPFLNSALSSVMNTERAKQWLYDLASKTSEDVELIRNRMPAEDLAAYDFTTAAGKVAGYGLGAWAAWEGLGALGGALPTMGWLGRASTPLARMAIKGALAGGLLGQNDDASDLAKNVGLGAVLGGASLYGALAPLTGAVFGATTGAQLGSELQGTPAERRANAIKYGIGGAALGALTPFLGRAFLKAREAYPTFGSIPVDQSRAPAAPGEGFADYEILGPDGLPTGGTAQVAAGQPQVLGRPQELLGPGGRPGPTNIDALFHQEPQATTEPGGQGVQGGSGVLAGPRVRGLLPASTVEPAAATQQYTAAQLIKTLGGIEGTDIGFYPTERVAQIQRQGDLQLFQAQRYAPAVPKALAGSLVANADGTPRVVYHGTNLDFEELDLAHANPGAQFGPGLYHTEDPVIAGGTVLDVGSRVLPAEPGYAQLPTIGQPGAVPNVRPALLDIKNPFDIDKMYSYTDITALTDKLKQSHPSYNWDAMLHEFRDLQAFTGDTATGEQVYNYLSNVETTEPLQGPEQRPVANYQPGTAQVTGEKYLLGKDGVNQALQSLGYDGITHIGGARTGNAPHRVWIAFKPEQVHSPFQYAALNAEQAAEAGNSISKQTTVLDSEHLVNAAAKPQMTESDVVAAAKATNPGGVSVIRGLGQPLDIFDQHPDVRFVQREGRMDALVGATDEQVKQYEQSGLFENQRVTLPDGTEGKISTHLGGMLMVETDAGHMLSVPVADALPSKFGAPQVDVPDLWQQFKTRLLSSLNYEAQQAGMAPVESIWDRRASDLMAQKLSDFLDEKGIHDPAARQAIDYQINQQYIAEARDLDPASRDLQDRIVGQAVDLANERAASREPIPTSLEDKAQTKGFIWLTEPGSGGGRLRDQLNPEASFDVPVASDRAAEEFLRNVDRAAPDLNPADAVPAEVMKVGPATGNSEPNLNLGDKADLTWEHVRDMGLGLDGELGEADFSGWEGGGVVPPGPGEAGTAGGGGFLPPPAETLGRQFLRLRRDDPAKYQALLDAAKGGQLRYTRYLMAKFENTLADAGVTLGRIWDAYDTVETNHAKASYEAKPWLEEYAGIVRRFDSRILRDGTVVRNHSIEGLADKEQAWDDLADRGYSDKQIAEHKAADSDMTDFFNRYFTWKGKGRGPQSEGGVFRYILDVRARQAQNDPAAFEDNGNWLRYGTQYFAEQSKEANLQFRSLHAADLGNYIIRAGMFDEYEKVDFNKFWDIWGEKGVPSQYTTLIRSHMRAMKYGYDPAGDLAVRGVQKVFDMFNVPLTSREASRIAGLPMAGMYRGMLGGRTSIFFRDAIQPLVTLAKVPAPTLFGVYGDVLKGGPAIYSEMRQRGLQGGWILPEAPAIEGAGVFEQQPSQLIDELSGLTEEQQQNREILARLGDVGRARAIQAIDRYTNSLNLYGKEQQLNRMIAGEAAWRHATTSLEEYRQAQTAAALQGDRSLAIDYEDFADKSNFSSFSPAQQRKFKELIDEGNDEEAANLFARQVADWSQHRFGTREQPKIVRSTFGRMGYALGNFTGQSLEGIYDGLSNGTPRQKARLLATYGAVNGALWAAEQATGWSFRRWMWTSALVFAGSPALHALADLVEAANGAIAKEEGRGTSEAEQGALNDIFRSNPVTGVLNAINPFSGYIRSINEYQAAGQGINPLEQSARYTITGDRGSRIDLQRQEQRQLDSAQKLQHEVIDQYVRTHPGFGALP